MKLSALRSIIAAAFLFVGAAFPGGHALAQGSFRDAAGADHPGVVQMCLNSAGVAIPAINSGQCAGGGGSSYTVTFGTAIGTLGTPGGFRDGGGLFQPFTGASGNLNVNCAVGCAGGSFNNNADGVATSASNGQAAAWLYGFNGITWDRARADTTNGLWVNVKTSVLPTGAATESTLSTLNGKVPSLGQALAAASVPVILPAATITTLTPPTTVTVQQSTASSLKGQVDPLTPASWAIAATGAAVPANAGYIGLNIAGNLVGPTGIAVGATVKAMTVAIVDSSGNQITSFGGSGGTAIGDNNAFTQGTTSETPIGCLYNTAYTNATSGRSTIARCGIAGQIYTNLDQVAGTALGTPAAYGSTPTGNALSVNAFVTNTLTAGNTNADGVAAGTANVSPVQSYDFVFNGITFDRKRSGGATGSTMVAGAAAAGSAIAGNPVLVGGSDGTNARAILTGTDGRISGNIAQVGGTTVDTNSGNKSAGTQRVVTATDQPAIPAAGQGATGSAPPAGAQYVGANTSGATGGLMKGLIQCDSTAIYDASTSGSTEIVALTASQTIYICGYSIMAGGTVNVKLVYGTGTNCGTGSTNMTPAWQLTAQAGIVNESAFWNGLKTASANALCVNASGAVAAQVQVKYAKL